MIMCAYAQGPVDNVYIYLLSYLATMFLSGERCSKGFEESFGFDLSTTYFSTPITIKNIFLRDNIKLVKILFSKINTYQRLFFCIKSSG